MAVEPDKLTERETEVLGLVRAGYSNKRIAFALGIAEGTVKNHLTSVYEKLDCEGRYQAIAMPSMTKFPFPS